MKPKTSQRRKKQPLVAPHPTEVLPGVWDVRSVGRIPKEFVSVIASWPGVGDQPPWSDHPKIRLWHKEQETKQKKREAALEKLRSKRLIIPDRQL